MGRKPKPDGEKKVQISVGVARAVRDEIERMAGAFNDPIGRFAENLLLEGWERFHENQGQFLDRLQKRNLLQRDPQQRRSKPRVV